jgi:hypothetical protein
MMIYTMNRFIYLCLCLNAIAKGPVGTNASLQDVWRIKGPTAKTTAATTFQLEYAISDRAKYARYKLFHKDCKEEFVDEETPMVKGDGNVVETEEEGATSPFYTMTLLPDPSGNGQIASVKLAPTVVATQPKSAPWSSSVSEVLSWLSSWIWGGDNSLHFCIRMGLWLPPQAGAMEVNFRETNVEVILGENGVVQKVELEARPMNPVSVHIAGAKLKSTVQKEDEAEGEETVAVEQMASAQEGPVEVLASDDTAQGPESEGTRETDQTSDEL